MSIEIAKELLKKGIALNDQELIAMANSLLDETMSVVNVATPDKQKKSAKKPTKKKASKKTEDKKDAPNFTMKKEKTGTKRIPVNKVKNRKNIFIDDKTEAIGDKTPLIKLAPRDRPRYKPIYKKCENENCIKKVKVLAGDGLVTSYLCDDCILGRKRRG